MVTYISYISYMKQDSVEKKNNHVNILFMLLQEPRFCFSSTVSFASNSAAQKQTNKQKRTFSYSAVEKGKCKTSEATMLILIFNILLW